MAASVKPEPSSPLILEELVGYLAPPDRRDLVNELERLGVRNKQDKIVRQLIGALILHLGELSPGPETTEHLTRLGLYVCRARDFFADRPYRMAETTEEGRALRVAEERPGPPTTGAVIEETPPAAQQGSTDQDGPRPESSRLIRD